MPSDATIEKVEALIRRGSNRAYFFDNLKSASWIRPLLKRNFFRTPPAPPHERDMAWYPSWPESRYLARVAGQDTAAVIDAIRCIPQTKNYRVHEDLIDAAIGMPAETANFIIAERIDEWLSFLEFFGMAERLARLTVHLAKGRQYSMALRIAAALLSVRAPDSDLPLDRKHVINGILTFVSDDLYAEILREFIPIFSAAVGLDWIGFLAGELSRALDIEQVGLEAKGNDYSQIWFPAIEQGPRGADEIPGLLALAVRDSCQALLKKQPETATRIFEELEKKKYSIFKRILLYLVYKRLAEDRERGIAIIKSRQYFDDTSCRHEYHLLVKALFPTVSQSDKEHYLGMVAEKPSFGLASALSEELWGRAPSVEELDCQWRREQLRRLRGIEDALSDEWRRKYDEWSRELGEPEPTDHFVATSAFMVGERSPKTADELARLSDDELIEFLKGWKPSGDWDGPSESGLVSVLANVVQNNPARFLAIVNEFKKFAPHFCYALFTGLQGAAKQRVGIDWGSLFEFVKWVLAHDDSGQSLRSWRGCRTAVLDLIVAGIEGNDPVLPNEFRSQVWSCIEMLLCDPDPGVEREDSSGEAKWTPLTTAINSIRGRALEAAIRYAIWLRIGFEKSSPEVVKQGFVGIPEVAKRLEEHLDVARDPSVAVRSIYGVWFPQVAMLDAGWAREHSESIFPSADEHRAYREAAWDAYIAFCRPYIGVFEILRDVYLWAIRMLPKRKEDRFADGRPRHRLVEHLMYYYSVGIIELSSDVIAVFWETAPADLRKFAVASTGRGLPGRDQIVNADAIRRLKELCEQRIAAVKLLPAERIGEYVGEVAEFGWWFRSEHFEFSWALAMLEKALGITDGAIEGGKELLARLSTSFSNAPRQILELLERILESGQRRHRIGYCSDEIKAMLRKGLESEIANVRPLAVRIRDKLLASGYREFRELSA